MSNTNNEFIQENPLLAFSLYSLGQAQYLVSLGSELQHGFKNPSETTTHTYLYYQFWLWVLGAYEVVRHMDKKGTDFSPSLKAATKELKIFLAEIRMPFAKQELRSSGKPVYSENSVVSLDKDMVFKIRGVDYSATDVIERFSEFYNQLTLSDVQGNDS